MSKDFIQILYDGGMQTPRQIRTRKMKEASSLYNPRSKVYNIYNLAQLYDLNIDQLESYLRLVSKVRKPDYEGFLQFLKENEFHDFKDIKAAHYRFFVKREPHMKRKWYESRCGFYGGFVC